ncbi:alkylhydroperoxidase AhpD family core domain-containing protein [Streptomyces sp. DvalAA-19]|nr:alkylhydroperoxidase AhpD family core domain-containing protein [Streptomyces sp. DvalAA-19]
MTTNPVHHDHASTPSPYAPEHPARLPWAELVPDVFQAMVRLDAAARKGLDPLLLELVKVRASQLNRCALCLDMHSKDALAAGESVERIVQLSAWDESRHFYTEKEIAALELTEAVTVLTDGFVPDEVYARAAEHFEPAELARLIAAITVINAWNRFGVTTRQVPGHYTPGAASTDRLRQGGSTTPRPRQRVCCRGLGAVRARVRGACAALCSRRAVPTGQIRPSSRTASRSSVSSLTDASMRARENSLMSRPWTISYVPFFVVTGKEEMMPSGTP